MWATGLRWHNQKRRIDMKSGYFIFTSVLALMLLTVPAFSGQQGASETSWKTGRYSLLGTSDLDTGYGSLTTSFSLVDYQDKSGYFDAGNGSRETNIMLA